MSCIWQIHVASAPSFEHLFLLSLRWRSSGERVRAHDKYIVLLCLFSQLHSPAQFLFAVFHISISSLRVFTFLSLYYICFPSFTLNLLPLCTIATAPPFLFCSLTFLPSRGLRPAVAVWFELFQVFSQQQGEMVMVLAGCVRTNSRGMRITEQRVRKHRRLAEIYILYLLCK